MLLSKDLKEFVESLNSNRVDYLVAGAFAVAWYGYPRFTADLDILIRPEASNGARVLKALQEFGFGSLGIDLNDLTSSGQVIQLGVKPNRIDLLTSVSGVSFKERSLGRSAGRFTRRHPGYIHREDRADPQQGKYGPSERHGRR